MTGRPAALSRLAMALALIGVPVLAARLPEEYRRLAQDSPPVAWLDRPLANWNATGAVLPAPPRAGETAAALRARCPIPSPDTAGHRAVEAAGWIAYDHLDRRLTHGDLAIVAGTIAADQACQPAGFQLFVFAGPQFAGTLSPSSMTTGRDAAAGAVRIVDADRILAEFARYANPDVPCCPTSRVTVEYRIDRSGPAPLLVPVGSRVTRTHAR
jgi:hypothetical protein